MKNLNLQSLIIIAVLALVTILWGIGSVPLFDPDEPVYAETAREMIKYSDYLSPRIFDNFWYDKGSQQRRSGGPAQSHHR